MDIRVISRRGSNPTLTPTPRDIPPKGLYRIFSLRQGSPRLGAQYTLLRRHPLRSKRGARAAPCGRRLPNQEGGVHCHPRRPFLVHLGIASHHRTNEWNRYYPSARGRPTHRGPCCGDMVITYTYLENVPRRAPTPRHPFLVHPDPQSPQ